MKIFSESGFDSGKWAGNLAVALRQTSIIDGLVPRGRVWRPNWNQLIQFEPIGISGPFFWYGKPAILADDGWLYVGYYIERGLRTHDSSLDYVLAENWHWYGFMECLENPESRLTLASLILNLPSERRCLWIRVFQGNKVKERNPFEFKDENTLMKAHKRFLSVPPDEWIDVVLGVRFSKEECLNHQKKIVSELKAPIIRADEIRWLVMEAQKKIKEESSLE
ncbi:MAG: hypothetical protein ABSG90_13565 [Dehalococcoidia bacterium]|jgi:hypothetical protein